MTPAEPATVVMRKKLALVLLEPACSSWQSDFPQTNALPWPVASWANPWSTLLMFTDAWMRLAWGLAPWFRVPSSRDE